MHLQANAEHLLGPVLGQHWWGRGRLGSRPLAASRCIETPVLPGRRPRLQGKGWSRCWLLLWPVGPVSLLPVEILWRRPGLKSQLRQRSRLNPTGASFQSRFPAARDGNNDSICLKRSGEDQGAESAYETTWHPVNTSLGCPAPLRGHCCTCSPPLPPSSHCSMARMQAAKLGPGA